MIRRAFLLSILLVSVGQIVHGVAPKSPRPAIKVKGQTKRSNNTLPASHYVRISQREPTNAAFAVAYIQLRALKNDGIIPFDQLNFTALSINQTSKPATTVPISYKMDQIKNQFANCTDKSKVCNPLFPSNVSSVIIQFPNTATVSLIVVNRDCKGCSSSLAEYQVEVVHTNASQRLVLKNPFPKKPGNVSISTVDSITIEPIPGKPSGPLVLAEIQLANARGVMPGSMDQMSVHVTLADGTKAQEGDCYNNNTYDTSCGAAPPSSANTSTTFVYTFPTWFSVTAVQVYPVPAQSDTAKTLCGNMSCAARIKSYQVKLVRAGEPSLAPAAFANLRLSGDKYNITVQNFTMKPPPPPPVQPPPPEPQPLPQPPPLPLPPSEPPHPSPPSTKPSLGLIVGLSITGLVLVVGGATIFMLMRKKSSGNSVSFSKLSSQFITDSTSRSPPFPPALTPLSAPAAAAVYYKPGRSPQEVQDAIEKVVAEVKALVKADDSPGGHLLLPTSFSRFDVRNDAVLQRYSLQHECYMWLLDKVWSNEAFKWWRELVHRPSSFSSRSLGQMEVYVQPTPGQQEEDSVYHSYKQIQSGAVEIGPVIAEEAAKMLQSLQLSPWSQPAAERTILRALLMRFVMGSITVSGSEVIVPGVCSGDPELRPVHPQDDVHKEYSIAALVSPSAAAYPPQGGVLYCFQPGCRIDQGGQPWYRRPIVIALVP